MVPQQKQVWGIVLWCGFLLILVLQRLQSGGELHVRGYFPEAWSCHREQGQGKDWKDQTQRERQGKREREGEQAHARRDSFKT